MGHECKEAPYCSYADEPMEDVKTKVVDAIEAHSEWACQYNDGELIADDLANTILQMFGGLNDRAKISLFQGCQKTM